MRKGLEGHQKPGRRHHMRSSAHKGSRLSKHGVTIHCSHCTLSGHNIATCERKKAGLPPIRKTKHSPIRAVDPAWSQATVEPIITQELHEQQEPASQPILSHITNPMLSQLQQEATQCSRPLNLPEPIPGSTYIMSNIPSTRPVPPTTATKSGRVSRPSAKRKATEESGKQKGKKKKKPEQ
ncbi:unnamed protein product [Urochloa humidicola]